MLASSHAKSGASRMRPYLTTSLSPDASSRSGSVRSVAMSISTQVGWWKAPIMFLPSGWLTPVLPPTEESTWAMTVVGTCRSTATRSSDQPEHHCPFAERLPDKDCHKGTQPGFTKHPSGIVCFVKTY